LKPSEAELLLKGKIKLMKKIIYTCPFVPAEWITAHGLQPSRILLATKSSKGLVGPIEGLCPFVRLFINKASAGGYATGIIITTLCDQMRRSFDILIRKCKLPIFLMNVPKISRNPAACKLYQDELKRLGQFLVSLGGSTPSNGKLAKVMLKYDNKRNELLSSAEFLSPRKFSQAIAEFSQYGKCKIKLLARSKKMAKPGKPVAIVGGPLLKDDFALFNCIEKAGGLVVLDASETGWRCFPSSFSRRRIYDNPLLELSDAYLGHIPDASRRPNRKLYDWLDKEIAKRKIRGIIFRRFVWCDTWHAELYQLKHKFGLPVLDIEVSGEDKKLPAQTIGRINAFLEMLS
jgi:benzoyl-CoA reductase/2-hydroxyglutaryl-CoA dehydratase subunit BcrC/BadD/HgdB